MVLHSHCKAGTTLVEDISEIYQRRGKGDCANSEDCEDIEFDWKNLIRSNNFNGNSHCEFFIFIFRRSFIVLLHQVLLAGGKNCAVGPKLKPNVKCSFALDVAESRVEFQVLLEAPWEEELQFHGLCASVMKNDLLTIELFVDQHIQVVLFLGHIDGYVNTFTKHLNWNGLAIVLII